MVPLVCSSTLVIPFISSRGRLTSFPRFMSGFPVHEDEDEPVQEFIDIEIDKLKTRDR